MNDAQHIQPAWLSEPVWLELLWKVHPSGHWDTTPGQIDYFDDILGQPVIEGLRKLEKAGLIVEPTTQQRLETLTIKELKPILRENGLKVGGKKKDLIERIIENVSPDRMPTVEPELFVLSDQGREMALGWRETKKAKKSVAIQTVLSQLEGDDIEAAVDTVFLYERDQIFQRGIGCNWESDSFKESQRKQCEFLMNSRPSALTNLSDEERRKVCIVAATRYLFGQGYADWVEGYLKDSPNLNDDKLLSAPTGFNNYRRQVASAKEVGWKLRLDTNVCEQRGCSFCPRLNGLIYEPDEAPELPFPECPMKGPCMAMYTTAHQIEGLAKENTPLIAEASNEPEKQQPSLEETPQQSPAKTKGDNWAGAIGLAIGAIAILLALLFVQNI